MTRPLVPGVYSWLTESGLELAAVAFYALASGALTYAGLLSESVGLQQFTAGETAVGLWFLYVGAVALYAGLYVVGYGTAWPRLRRMLG